MAPFDEADSERRRPSTDTPNCALCDDAGLPRYGGFCFRHALLAVSVGVVRPVA